MLPTTVLLLCAFLTPVIVLAGVVTGAWIAHRAARGESPIPSLPRRVKVIGRDKAQDDGKSKVQLPDVRA